jgi:tetratricopeptide (TPR) repeat protein
MRALVGVCLLLAGLLAGCASGPGDAAHLKAGNEAFDRWETGGTTRDLESAIEHYKQVTGEQEASGLKNLGDAYRELRRLPEAEAAYRRALRLREAEGWPTSPRIADLAHDLATVYRLQGRTDQALALYQRAARIYEKAQATPRMAMAYHSLAHLHDARGELAEAQRMDQKALELVEAGIGADAAPNNPGFPVLTHYTAHYASILRRAGRDEDARRYDERAAALLRQLKDYAATLREQGRDHEAHRLEYRLRHE